MLKMISTDAVFFVLTLLSCETKKCIAVAFLQSSTKSTQVEPFRRRRIAPERLVLLKLHDVCDCCMWLLCVVVTWWWWWWWWCVCSMRQWRMAVLSAWHTVGLVCWATVAPSLSLATTLKVFLLLSLVASSHKLTSTNIQGFMIRVRIRPRNVLMQNIHIRIQIWISQMRIMWNGDSGARH